MICYFDTSAVIPLLIAEPNSPSCARLWTDADAVVTSRMLYAEAAAALAQAERMDRITADEHVDAIRSLEQLWPEFEMVEVNDAVVRRAAVIARSEALRGYDSVHCASADQVADADLLVASGDKKLLEACRSLGLTTADVNGP
jgi:predicted nucleic acid-binding protein